MWYAVVVPRFEPFPGLRYDPAVPLDDVIAPPYDVVGPEEREKLASRHEANSIQVELPLDDPVVGVNKYHAAARLLRSWIDQGIVRRDPVPSMYTYRMIEPGGVVTTGVVGALSCDPSGADVLPHEQTIPKDKSDRLDLLRACRANLSPIWGLSLTEGLSQTFEPAGNPEREATDDAGVVHQLWVIDAPERIRSVSQAVARSPVVIADGHHRYETASVYRAERRTANDDSPGDYDLVMALVVELAEDQLSVGAIHRLLNGIPQGVRLPDVLSRWFECRPAGEPTEPVVEDLVRSATLTLVTPDEAWALTARRDTLRAASSELDSSLVALALADLPESVVSYVHEWPEALAAVRNGSADAALLLRPVTVAQISEWAHARRRMPPKSTYFHPKPRTGMVFRPVAD